MMTMKAGLLRAKMPMGVTGGNMELEDVTKEIDDEFTRS